MLKILQARLQLYMSRELSDVEAELRKGRGTRDQIASIRWLMITISNIIPAIILDGPQDWKSSVFVPITKKGNAKECSNYCTIALISHASKVMLKILQVRL